MMNDFLIHVSTVTCTASWVPTVDCVSVVGWRSIKWNTIPTINISDTFWPSTLKQALYENTSQPSFGFLLHDTRVSVQFLQEIICICLILMLVRFDFGSILAPDQVDFWNQNTSPDSSLAHHSSTKTWPGRNVHGLIPKNRLDLRAQVFTIRMRTRDRCCVEHYNSLSWELHLNLEMAK